MITPAEIIGWLNLGRIFVKPFKKSRCLLIVEDNASDVELLAIFLRQRKHLHDVAMTGEEALAKLRSGKYDLVFLDLRLPLMDGWGLLKHIEDECPNVQVVITCGDHGDLRNMPRGAPFYVMLKPPSLHGVDKILK